MIDEKKIKERNNIEKEIIPKLIDYALKVGVSLAANLKELTEGHGITPTGFVFSIDGWKDLCTKVAFKSAEFAIQEFLKGLWHDASEEPKQERYILMEMNHGSNYSLYWVNSRSYIWGQICFMFTTTKWLYIEDLLPKQKGDEK